MNMKEIKRRLSHLSMEIEHMDKVIAKQKESPDTESVETVDESALTVPHHIHEWFDSSGGTDTFLSAHLNKVVALSYESEEDLAEEQRKVFEWLFQEGEGVNEEANAQIQVAKMYCNGYIVKEEE